MSGPDGRSNRVMAGRWVGLGIYVLISFCIGSLPLPWLTQPPIQMNEISWLLFCFFPFGCFLFSFFWSLAMETRWILELLIFWGLFLLLGFANFYLVLKEAMNGV